WFSSLTGILRREGAQRYRSPGACPPSETGSASPGSALGQLDAVAARALGLVQRAVGGGDQILEARVVRRVHGDSDRDREVELAPVGQMQRCRRHGHSLPLDERARAFGLSL